MKLIELQKNQRVTIQLLWGEQKIEFFSNVLDKGEAEATVYVSPYFHNGSELQLDVTPDKDVVCNLFTNNPSTKQRISWKNIELTTVTHNDKIMYCLKTNGYNHIAKHDDRRKHDRVVVSTKAQVLEEQAWDGIDVIIYDISDIGISFFAPISFAPEGHQLTIVFSDNIAEKEFKIKLECVIARTTNRVGNRFVGCRILTENKDFQLYSFLKRLDEKVKR